jgi:hypothetical protein
MKTTETIVAIELELSRLAHIMVSGDTDAAIVAASEYHELGKVHCALTNSNDIPSSSNGQD